MKFLRLKKLLLIPLVLIIIIACGENFHLTLDSSGATPKASLSGGNNSSVIGINNNKVGTVDQFIDSTTYKDAGGDETTRENQWNFKINGVEVGLIPFQTLDTAIANPGVHSNSKHSNLIIEDWILFLDSISAGSGTGLALGDLICTSITVKDSEGLIYEGESDEVCFCHSIKEVYSYTGADQVGVVPAGVDRALVKAWGAGGAGASGSTGFGGVGAYVEGTFSPASGAILTYIVGQGGIFHGLTSTYGGGGAGGDYTPNSNQFSGSSGGGRTALRNSIGNEILTAGGGAGSSGATANNSGTAFAISYAGAGGTLNGQDAEYFLGCVAGIAATGGGQALGGAGGTGNRAGSAGIQYQGGAGGIATSNSTGGGGGGGGGYFGGGGGQGQHSGGSCGTGINAGRGQEGSGAGGSSYIDSSVFASSGFLAAGSREVTSVIATSDIDYVAGTSETASGAGANGGNGQLAIYWVPQCPSGTEVNSNLPLAFFASAWAGANYQSGAQGSMNSIFTDSGGNGEFQDTMYLRNTNGSAIASGTGSLTIDVCGDTLTLDYNIGMALSSPTLTASTGVFTGNEAAIAALLIGSFGDSEVFEIPRDSIQTIISATSCQWETSIEVTTEASIKNANPDNLMFIEAP